jgi:hypothetical protein
METTLDKRREWCLSLPELKWLTLHGTMWVSFSALADFAVRHHVHTASEAHTTPFRKGTHLQRGPSMKLTISFRVRKLGLHGGIEYFHKIVNFFRY